MSNSSDIHGAARSGDLISIMSICSSNPLAVNSRDKHSRTPLKPRLHLAAWAGQVEVVNYLCRNMADIGAAAMDDMGAIHFASQKGHLEVVRTLISYGVSVKASNRKGMTALHYAVQGSYLDMVKYLVKKGADINTKNRAGKSPLDLASSEEIRSFLLNCKSGSKEGDKHSDLNEEDQPKPLPQEQVHCCDSEATDARSEESEYEKNESNKRKGDGGGTDKNSVKPKKAKFALSHLVASDDTQEEEEDV